jgi:hypothetical protein
MFGRASEQLKTRSCVLTSKEKLVALYLVGVESFVEFEVDQLGKPRIAFVAAEINKTHLLI